MTQTEYLTQRCMQCDEALGERLDCPDRHLRFCLAKRYDEGRMPVPAPVKVQSALPPPRSLGYLPPMPSLRIIGNNPPIAEWQADNAYLLNDPCSYCSERATTLDHITPRWLGGRNTADNTTAACRSCNSSKGKWPLLIWLARRCA